MTLPDATVSESDGIRYLHLSSIWIQGAMRIRQPQQVVLDYVQRMLASLLWLPTDLLGSGRALQLGLGAGAITRCTQRTLGMPTTVVELNPSVLAANRHWFHLSSEVEVVLDDAGRYMQQRAEAGSVQLLHVDLYDQDAAAPVLDSAAFYADCRSALDHGGVMGVNLFGRNASFARSAARIADAFGADQVWSLRPTREGNTIVVAGRGVVVPGRDDLTARAAAIEQRCGLPARKWLRMVRPWVAAPGPQHA